MRRVAEIIHIVDSEREEFLKGILNPDEEAKKMLWLCGVRKQQYFALNDLIFMTFEYKGNDFEKDMQKMAIYLDSKGYLVRKRRKDVPVSERETTNWWAPVKKLGTLLETKPESLSDEEEVNDCLVKLDGQVMAADYNNDIAFDEDDWSESMHF